MQQRISFTTFMDFVLANGPSKLARVRAAVAMYTADEFKAASYYRELKDAILECFGGAGVIALDRCLKRVADPRKAAGYEAAIAGLKTWLRGKRKTTTFPVSPVEWSVGGLTVSVRPELGLVVDGERLVVKLYLKEDKLDQRRINPLLHLLEETHGHLGRVMILDCRRGKAYFLTRRIQDVDAFLRAEAQSFLLIWEQIAA